VELASVGLKILPFTFFDYFRESLCLAIVRDPLGIPLQTLVIFALVTLDCFSFFSHFPPYQINLYTRYGYLSVLTGYAETSTIPSLPLLILYSSSG
jgi:hypothetical protein